MTDRYDGPVARAQMLIRKPVTEVFRALTEPAVTSQFWFSASSGPLETGRQVRWTWEMYGVSANVTVMAVEANDRILIEWNGPGHPSLVEWTFQPRAVGQTLVIVENWGFRGDEDEVLKQVVDATGGFAFLLAALKAYLEHGLNLRLIEDHDPRALARDWSGRRTAKAI